MLLYVKPVLQFLTHNIKTLGKKLRIVCCCCRLLLAAIHDNYNSKRDVARSKRGSAISSVCFKKVSKGEAFLQIKKQESSYSWYYYCQLCQYYYNVKLKIHFFLFPFFSLCGCDDDSAFQPDSSQSCRFSRAV